MKAMSHSNFKDIIMIQKIYFVTLVLKYYNQILCVQSYVLCILVGQCHSTVDIVVCTMHTSLVYKHENSIKSNGFR